MKNLFEQILKIFSNNQNKANNDNLIITKQQRDDLLKENEKLLKEKTKLQQTVKIQQQENEAKAEALYEEMLDIYDSLEFLINYLDTNLQDDNFNPKAFKRLPKFTASVQEKLLTILSRREVEKIDFNGNIPDFSVCQVVDREIRDDIPDQTITKIVRQGFKMKEKILRYVEVITAKSNN
ncbi:heat shock protein GrpE [Geminocystis sp. NIES-3708]|uniref:nucleotide exchange factor GrpE n=1 Tax=Geminocystis sp. NIES-3708 TaxID=1615909 RepID=UPI0005FC4D0A|nr:nucleotide exchange factor GrpE [Geminocystis sp. NIES-3708]BAQ61255.1 heat shock protein GrpE [Geminocystis sp. NIES-3708]